MTDKTMQNEGAAEIGARKRITPFYNGFTPFSIISKRLQLRKEKRKKKEKQLPFGFTVERKKNTLM